MRLTFILLTFFYGLTANAQKNFVLNGTVIDSITNEPLENVFVVISDIKKNTLTDVQGFFEIKNLKQGTYFLSTSIVGYTPIQTKITLKTDSVLTIQIKN